MDSTAPPPPQISPTVPWQVRWKRPQFNNVILGIDEDTSFDCNNNTSSNDIKNSNDELYEELNVDEINKQWIPISNSSIVLTRKESQTVINELNKRDKLLIRRRKRKGAHDVNNNLSSANDGKSKGGYVLSNNEKVTPKNKNTKSSVIRRATAGVSLLVNNDKTSKSTSMSNWFKSITSPSNTSNNTSTISLGGKPPRAKTPTTTSTDNITSKQQQSQLSPTGKTFTTFNVKTPPPNPLPNFADSSQQGNNMYDSPPDNDDCQVSTASSLLWEDMTLTSVSEEDALHYHGSRRLRGRETATEIRQQQQQATDKDDGSTDSSKRRLFNSATAPKQAETRDELGGGRYYYDRHGNLRLSDWDGYDNVVLSTTIYYAGSCSTSADRRGRSSGEVMVMELLSTKNPPSSSSSKTEGTKSTTTIKNKGGKKKIVEEHLKLSSSDSSSHASSPASGKGEQSKTISSDDVSTNSTSTTTNNTKQYDEEEEGTSNHTRILTRRVLYWPSYINNEKDKMSDCPSFVSLGRTNIWKERKSHDIDEPLAAAREVDEEEEQEQDVTSQPKETGNTLLGNICGPLFDNDESDGAEESSGSEDQPQKKKDQEQQIDTLPDSSNEERVADAMEVYRSLNFLFGGSNESIAPSSEKANSTSTKKTRKIDVAPRHYPILDKKKKKLTQPLSMCLVTSNGTVHFFHALRVLLSGDNSSNKRSNKNDDIEDLSNSFASLFMGSNLFTKVNDSVMPLSHPRATVQLSQLVPSSGSRKGEESLKHDNDSPSIWHTFLLQQRETDEPNEQASFKSNEWSKLGTFDASIDPRTLPLRTIRQSNVITGTCVTSDTNNGYLAICGKGLRHIIHKSKDENNRRHISHILGGYVTFISLRHNTESRTVYVPFAPDSIQPIYWMGMHFVVLLGEEGRVTKGGLRGQQHRSQQRRPYAMAIRVDCSQGCTSFFDERRLGMAPQDTSTKQSSLLPNRFQCISIALPSISDSLGVLHLSQLLTTSGSLQQLDCVETRAVAVSSIPSSPPGIILSYRVGSTLVVVNHTLLPFQAEGVAKKQIMLSTLVRPGHRAILNVGHLDAPNSGDVWCLGGQGWSLVGIQGGQKSHFICWDGATDDTQGPYILPFNNESLVNEKQCLSSVVTPLMSYIKYAERVSESSHSKVDNNLPNTSTKSSFRLPSFLQQNEVEGDFASTGFTMPKRSLSSTLKESIKVAAIIEGGVDEIIINALDSISSLKHKSLKSSGIGGSRSNRTKNLAMSHQEKSKRLLRQCSSWTQLDDTKANRGIIHGQVIVATVRVRTECQSLTLRTNTVANPISTPFNQVLSWLCQRRDYYTAASVALSLLDDAVAVYELCGIVPKTPDEELTHHKGLLDGIKPLGDDSSHGNMTETMTSLADMAVGCMIKGGVSMSKTLDGFLSRNKLYNAPRACLMLVGATASALSLGEPATKPNKKDTNIMDMLSSVQDPSEDLLWPVRCLMRMAVVRKCLPSATLMLNYTISNELRWQAPKSRGLSPSPRPSLGLFLALVEIILESSEKVTRLLLDMMVEETGSSYWFSIDDDARLALCLMSIRGKHVMIQEPEVRVWMLDKLKEEIESLSESSYNHRTLLPNEWLKEVITGSFCNAGCDLLGLDSVLMSSAEELTCYRQDMLRVRDVLAPEKYSCDLDYDILIASLLILARRDCDSWKEGSHIPVQTLLNSVCNLAGRKTGIEPKFIFDSSKVMYQCALSDNLQAAAFLVGGKKGMVIECADLLVSTLDMSVDDAEKALFTGSLVNLKKAITPLYDGISIEKKDDSIFSPDLNHQHLLWILEEHVLNIQKYGEFDSSVRSQKITPVFVGRVCFRAWYCLTHPKMLNISAKWLEEWLRKKVDLNNGQSSKRLACAALVRTLLWADEAEDLDDEDEPILAAVLGFDGRFMAELAQACCGLIESIPSHLAEELMSSYGSTNMFSSLDISPVNSIST